MSFVIQHFIAKVLFVANGIINNFLKKFIKHFMAQVEYTMRLFKAHLHVKYKRTDALSLWHQQ